MNTARAPFTLGTIRDLDTTTCTGAQVNAILTSLLGAVQTTISGGTYQGNGTANAPDLQREGTGPSFKCNASTGGAQLYALGNFLNYQKVPPTVLVAGPNGDYKLKESHTAGGLGCPNTTTDDEPIYGSQWLSYWSFFGAHAPDVQPWSCLATDGASANVYNTSSPPPSTQKQLIYNALNTVVNGARYSVKFGAMVYSSNNHGGQLINPVANISAQSAFTAFMNTLPGSPALTSSSPGWPLASNTARPQGGALYDAYQYFLGASGPTYGDTSKRYSPAFTSYYCEHLAVILITDGSTNGDQITGTTGLASVVGDTDGNCTSPNSFTSESCTDQNAYTDDLAKMMYWTGVPHSAPTSTVPQRITTNVLLAFQADDPELRSATNTTHGHGLFFSVSNSTDLANKLSAIINSIMLEASTSFVAPVVPVSPENKVYTGNRVYMGFFQPKADQYWFGNLKKYALDSSGNILDATGAFANYVDQNLDGIDDRGDKTPGDSVLPQGSTNGSFRPSAQSYWSTALDGGAVNAGGAGAVLQNRDFSVAPRNIYTYLDGAGAITDLTNSHNAFSTTNPSLTASVLGLPGAIITSSTTTEVNQLINFVHGIDVYDDNGNRINTEKREWIFGDVLHSKPFVMNYASYTFNPANEASCPPSGLNKTMIFVGSNDGMVHAINDCDGSEAWAFIPPDILPYLQYNHGPAHTYFVDSTIYGYVYDHNQNGTIETADGDKVVLIIGLRRGGGILGQEPTQGYYYALDVSNRTSPVFLWSISNSQVRKGITTTASTDYANLGEAWSEPKIARISAQTTYDTSVEDRIVIFIGGGYDNCNEDGRFGATQKFSGSCQSTIMTNDGGLVTSGGDLALSPPLQGTLAGYKGRAVYAVELAKLDNGVPDFTNSGNLVHAFTTTGYSMLSEMTALDTNFDGYADRLYMGDTGGNIWRFNVISTDPAAWTMTQIFSSNPGADADSSVGRKIFYKPSAVVDTGGVVRLYFGTGDREHPLNRAVKDRMYEVIDKGQGSAVTEAQLVDVTEDDLQTTTDPTSPAFQDLLANLADTSDPSKTNFYGWYIRLDQNSGEKVLAGATVYNKVVYYPTYSPNTAVVTDPCAAGNLGTARIYVVDYQNGSAVMNFDTSNDSQYTTYRTNSYATPTSAGGNVLLRSDRVQPIGVGILSGIVVTGDKILIGCGGGICTMSANPGGQVLPLFWRQR